MDANEADRQVRAALATELSKHWGQIATIEAKVSRSEGYLRKFCRGQRSISLGLLLETLEVLDVEPGSFFARALGAARDTDGFLRDLRQPGKEAPVLRKIEKTTLQLAAESPGAIKSRRTSLDQSRAMDLVAKISPCSLKEQRRRLKTAVRYRDPAFAAAYLGDLDAHRYEDPQKVAKQLETVILHLIPALRCDVTQRLDLQCQAIALFSAARRLVGDFPSAARAASFALELARKHTLKKSTAVILRRGSFLLTDHGHVNQALILLREAFEIYFDLDSPIDMGKTLVDRGYMLLNLGEYEETVQVSEKALRMLGDFSPEEPELRRCYLATYDALARASENLGDLEGAENWLKNAVRVADTEGGINRAKLVWHQGRIAFARHDHAAAEQYLSDARQLFDQLSAPDGALVCLDLTRVLLVQGKAREASDLATQMAAFLQHFRQSRVAEAAIGEFMKLSLQGKLTRSLIDQTQTKLYPPKAPRRLGARTMS